MTEPGAAEMNGLQIIRSGDLCRNSLPDRPARFMPRYDEQIETVLELKPPVFSFVFGVPSADVLERCRRAGIVTIGAATIPEEAKLLADAGVDMVVASGMEAGGHRVSFLREPEDCLTGTLALVPAIVDTVQVPVIAAGGIVDARGVGAVLKLGASAAQIGTAFLACEESNASPEHRAALFSEATFETTLTRAFTGRLARGIANRWTREAAAMAHAPYPLQQFFTRELKRAAQARGGDARTQLVSLWSSQAAPNLTHRTADALIDALVADVH